MIDRPRIGIQVDHDARHYSFVRNSGFRREDFKTKPDAASIGDAVVVAGAVLVIALIAFGAIA